MAELDRKQRAVRANEFICFTSIAVHALLHNVHDSEGFLAQIRSRTSSSLASCCCQQDSMLRLALSAILAITCTL